MTDDQNFNHTPSIPTFEGNLKRDKGNAEGR